MVTEIARWFELSDDQLAILKALREDHQSRFDAFVAEVAPDWQPLEDEARAVPRATLLRHQKEMALEEVLADIADRQEKLDIEFFSSLQSVLTIEQAARWEDFRLWLTRQRWGGRAGWYLEQTLDLIALLRAVDQQLPDVSGTVSEELEREYARALDSALHELAAFEIDWSRNRMRNEMDRLHTDGEKVWLGAWSDPAKAKREDERRRTLNRAIRDVNHRYASVFAATLEEPKATVWRRLHRDALLQRIDYDSGRDDETNELIVGSLRTQPAFDRLLTVVLESTPDLSDEHRATIDAIVLVRDRSLSALLEHLVNTNDDLVEPRSLVGDWKAAERELEAAYRRAVHSLVHVENRARTALLALLTPEQRTAIESTLSQSGKPNR